MAEEKSKKFIGRIFYLIVVLILIVFALKLYDRFRQNNFNDFIRTEYIPYTSQFLRDKDVRYSDVESYKIVSNNPNDAMFYQTIAVTPNTPYKVTCMVKTQDVKPQKEISVGGAHISIADTVEKSKSITGTNDWQKLEFIFNSKNRTSVDIGFRLGGYDDDCTGTAWFSDFTIEVGSATPTTQWNFACFMIKNVDVTFQNNGQNHAVKLSMSPSDINDMVQNMSRFQTSCEELSHHKMSVDYDVITIDEPLTTLSYDEENGYYAGPENVASLIEPYLQQKNYDHIFICLRLGDNSHTENIPIHDWIGLGAMDYLGTGFSNIRLPNDDKSYTYKYDYRVNTFPEEVFLHEFLHTLERNAKEYGLARPELHSYATYGYQDERLIGLKKWYEDYMNQTIKSSGGYVGLPDSVYTMQPNHEDDFTYSYKMPNVFKEPKGFLEKFKQIVSKAFTNVRSITIQKEGNNEA